MMKIIKLTLLILFFSGTIFGQIRNIKKDKKLEREERKLKKEEEKLEKQEEKTRLKYIKENVFKKDYKVENYPKFNGIITLQSNSTIKFDERILLISSEIKEEYKLIFTEGIFHPNLIFGNRIGHFEELTSLNPNYKTKRFLIWIYMEGLINPTELYFEIKNPNATKNMGIVQFIKGSILRFYKKGGLII